VSLSPNLADRPSLVTASVLQNRLFFIVWPEIVFLIVWLLLDLDFSYLSKKTYCEARIVLAIFVVQDKF